MGRGDNQYKKMRDVNKNFYNLPPKDKKVLEQSCSGMPFDMKKDDNNKQSERLMKD